MGKDTVRLDEQERIATITIDRPPLNVLDMATMDELGRTIREVSKKGTAGVIIIRSAGEKVFSAGVEIKEHTPDLVPGMLDTFHGLVRLLLEIDPVSIAEVQAPALGGGAELALACDLVVAAEESRFAFPEIELACFPPVALATLPLRVGPQRAAELVLTGGAISAGEARQMGLVNRVIPRAGLSEATAELARNLCKKSPEVLRLTTRLLRKMVSQPYTGRLQQAEDAYLKELLPSHDMQEGIRAFMEKRKPKWRGTE